MLCLVLVFLSGSFVLGLDDLDTAAITVYRNPDFFRHLSDGFSDHVGFFSKNPERNYGAADSYDSPATESYRPYRENYSDEDESENQEADTDDESENQEEEEDVPVNHRDKYRSEDEEDDSSNYGEDNNNNYEEDDNNNYEEEDNNNLQEDDNNLQFDDINKYKDFDSNRYQDIGNKYSAYGENDRLMEEDNDGYKYPGEPKKPNPPGPRVNVHFDGSPDFGHPPRNIPLAPGPKKKGRGPYGHPRHTDEEVNNYQQKYEDSRPKSGGHYGHPRHTEGVNNYHQKYEVSPQKFGGPYEHPKHTDEEAANYHQEYEDSRLKSEEQLLEEVAKKNYEEARQQGPKSKEQLLEDYEARARQHPQHVPLNVYHQGQKINHYKYPPYIPTQEEIVETKKGTREHLKHHKLPPNHELSDYHSQKQKKAVKVGCKVKIRPKKTYAAYKIRPKHIRYKVLPVKVTKVKPVYFAKPYRRKSGPGPRPKPRYRDDDSAYVLNSELDQDFQQKIRVTHG